MKKPVKRILRLACILLLLLVALVVLAGWFLVDYSLTPSRMSDDEAFARRLEHAPWIASWVDSVRRTGALRDTFIVRDDGVRLHAWWVAAPNATRNVALLVHGYNTQGLDMIHLGYMFHHDLGFNIFMPDLYAHGHSDGDAIGMGWPDRLDLLRWIAVADEKWCGDSTVTRMTVLGVSMGAATVMSASGETMPPCVTRLIEDCGYTSVWDEFASEARQRFGMPPFPLLYVANAMCRLRHGWSFDQASPLRQVARCRLPMLFIHGDSDTFVPSPMVHPLYQAKPEPKRLWVTKGVPHARSYDTYPEEYTRQVAAFIAQDN